MLYGQPRAACGKDSVPFPKDAASARAPPTTRVTAIAAECPYARSQLGGFAIRMHNWNLKKWENAFLM